MQNNFRRREFLGMAAGTVAALTVARPRAAHANDTPAHGGEATPALTPDEALKRLLDGNERFQRDEHILSHHTSKAWRKELVPAQHPVATVLGCCDSRVPPEIVFDQGVGDLFVMRVAGNVVDADMIGSLAYAFEHLKTPLFMVLGHERCGAVRAAVEQRVSHVHDYDEIEELLMRIGHVLDDVDLTGPRDEVVARAVEANVRHSMMLVREAKHVKEGLAEGKVKLVGGVYDLASGRVRLLEDKPLQPKGKG